jgi:hypothetical protein
MRDSRFAVVGVLQAAVLTGSKAERIRFYSKAWFNTPELALVLLTYAEKS